MNFIMYIMNMPPKPPKLRRQIGYDGEIGHNCPFDLNHKSNSDIRILWEHKRRYRKKKLAELGRLFFIQSLFLSI